MRTEPGLAVAELEAAVAEDPRYAHTTSLLVLRGGAPVLERGAVDVLADTYSVTKSVVATVVGIALARGDLDSLDRTVGSCLGGYDPRTLRHLLTMTGGAEPLEIDDVMALPAGWLERIREAPLVDAPGSRFRYDNAAAHVLACAVAAALGRRLSDYAAEHLFGPLALHWEWPSDPEGRSYGFGHLLLRPRDLATLGELYRSGGGGLLDPSFVAAATTAHTRGGPPEGAGHGYLWWVAQRCFFAGGYAGQALVVIPELEVVAVATGEESLLRPGWRNARHAIEEVLLP